MNQPHQNAWVLNLSGQDLYPPVRQKYYSRFSTGCHTDGRSRLRWLLSSDDVSSPYRDIYRDFVVPFRINGVEHDCDKSGRPHPRFMIYYGECTCAAALSESTSTSANGPNNIVIRRGRITPFGRLLLMRSGGQLLDHFKLFSHDLPTPC
ncbi:unnamed protein product [Kuraishia capsulata CBS 1993]|uniref:Uncharacterized protein n=1 Tax=Kuraishia capsulata CBS 1993 TaxID=1382522 RepID=W6MLX4_9ASCO|nr:uncharacterized protein KUCA_T00001863001 [Kuraishia capsulata CBS 1993]CDK25892.1 unnamed protein product [Kuraishia capsulata CBS 1993]